MSMSCLRTTRTDSENGRWSLQSDSPGAIAGFDGRYHLIARGIHDADVVRHAIRRVQLAAVRGESDAPRALSDRNQRDQCQLLTINHRDAVPAPGRHINTLPIRGDGDAFRFELRRALDARQCDGLDDRVISRIDYRHDVPVFRSHISPRAI